MLHALHRDVERGKGRNGDVEVVPELNVEVGDLAVRPIPSVSPNSWSSTADHAKGRTSFSVILPWDQSVRLERSSRVETSSLVTAE